MSAQTPEMTRVEPSPENPGVLRRLRGIGGAVLNFFGMAGNRESSTREHDTSNATAAPETQQSETTNVGEFQLPKQPIETPEVTTERPPYSVDVEAAKKQLASETIISTVKEYDEHFPEPEIPETFSSVEEGIVRYGWTAIHHAEKSVLDSIAEKTEVARRDVALLKDAAELNLAEARKNGADEFVLAKYEAVVENALHLEKGPESQETSKPQPPRAEGANDVTVETVSSDFEEEVHSRLRQARDKAKVRFAGNDRALRSALDAIDEIEAQQIRLFRQVKEPKVTRPKTFFRSIKDSFDYAYDSAKYKAPKG